VKLWEQARKTNHIQVHGERIEGPFAGIENDGKSSVLEFVPRRLQAKVNQPISWTVMGRHTISFDVPPYAPIIQFRAKDIRYNPVVRNRAGGAPAAPEGDEDGNIPDYDAGTYDGTGFWSTGLIGSDSFMKLTLRISKAGTYPYACLVHPKMIGQIVVSA
jgi:plastocyanin